MANTHGGVLLVGINAAGRPTGIVDAGEARAVLQTAGLLASPPLILPLPQTIEVDGKTVCSVEVPPGLPHVYSMDGRYLTRTGAQNRLLERGRVIRPAAGARRSRLRVAPRARRDPR